MGSLVRVIGNCTVHGLTQVNGSSTVNSYNSVSLSISVNFSVSLNWALALRNTIGRKFAVETTSVSPSQRARELPIHRRMASLTRGRPSNGMTRWSCTISLRTTTLSAVWKMPTLLL